MLSNKYWFDGNVPEILCDFLDYVLGPRDALGEYFHEFLMIILVPKLFLNFSVSLESTILAVSIFLVHTSKRLYETRCVSIFSNAKINICHYIAGHLHYFGTTLAMIGYSSACVRGKIVEIFVKLKEVLKFV